MTNDPERPEYARFLERRTFFVFAVLFLFYLLGSGIPKSAEQFSQLVLAAIMVLLFVVPTLLVTRQKNKIALCVLVLLHGTLLLWSVANGSRYPSLIIITVPGSLYFLYLLLTKDIRKWVFSQEAQT